MKSNFSIRKQDLFIGALLLMTVGGLVYQGLFTYYGATAGM